MKIYFNSFFRKEFNYLIKNHANIENLFFVKINTTRVTINIYDSFPEKNYFITCNCKIYFIIFVQWICENN